MTSVYRAYRLSVVVLLLVFVLHHWCLGTPQPCALYLPPTPGLRCLRNTAAEETLKGSRWVWMVELYSSWCGHCQQFAPRFKKLAEDLEAWSLVLRVGVLECTESKENQDMCRKFGVQAYPTIRFFKPVDPNPLKYEKRIVGAKDISEIQHHLVHHILSVQPTPQHWPDLNTVMDAALLQEAAPKWTPTVLVFEEDASYVGAELILDFMKIKALRVKRVASNNTHMVQHYAILEFPSIVIELTKNNFHLISGHSQSDPRSGFKRKITEYIRGTSPVQPSLKSHDWKSTPTTHDHNHPQRHLNRVDVSDVLGAVSYSLRYEVTVHAIISGSKYSNLYNYLILLEQALSRVFPVAVGDSLKAVRLKLEGRKTHFITSREIQRILDNKLDAKVFPQQPIWKACNGSLPHQRGYPCALWMLMHTLTILTLPLHSRTLVGTSTSITSRQALVILTRFLTNFFTCEVCRQHFTVLTTTLPPFSLGNDGDAILWLWQAHNLVSTRLAEEGRQNPDSPKALFPSHTRCPYCYKRVSYDQSHVLSHDQQLEMDEEQPKFNNTDLRFVVESGGESRQSGWTEAAWSVHRGRGLKVLGVNGKKYVFVWNRTSVLLYLWNFYHLEYYENSSVRTESRHSRLYQQHRVLLSSILQAAWPSRFRNQEGRKEWFHKRDWPRLQSDSLMSGIHVLSFIVCVLLVVFASYLLYHRRDYKQSMRRFKRFPLLVLCRCFQYLY